MESGRLRLPRRLRRVPVRVLLPVPARQAQRRRPGQGGTPLLPPEGPYLNDVYVYWEGNRGCPNADEIKGGCVDEYGQNAKGGGQKS